MNAEVHAFLAVFVAAVLLGAIHVAFHANPIASNLAFRSFAI